jgi:hypothetical protein
MEISIQPEWKNRLSGLRSQIEALPTDGNGKRKGISMSLRRQIAITFVQSGLKLREFSEAVGVSISAIRSWKNQFVGEDRNRERVDRPQGFKMMKVQESGRWRVEGPMGLSIQNLTPQEVASLWRALC